MSPSDWLFDRRGLCTRQAGLTTVRGMPPVLRMAMRPSYRVPQSAKTTPSATRASPATSGALIGSRR